MNGNRKIGEEDSDEKKAMSDESSGVRAQTAGSEV